MRFLFFLFALSPTFGLWAQNNRPASFYLEVEGLATRSVLLTKAEDIRGHFNFGGGLAVNLSKDISPTLTLQTGLKYRMYRLRQRSTELRFGCDVDFFLRGEGKQSYVDIETSLSSIVLPLALQILPGGKDEGVYFKTSIDLSYNVGDKTDGKLHECGLSESSSFAFDLAKVRPVNVFAGLGLGYQLKNKRGRTIYLELNVSSSLGKVVERQEGGFLNFSQDAGALVGDITFGWQLLGDMAKDQQ